MLKKPTIVGKSLYFMDELNEPFDLYYYLLANILHITFYCSSNYPIILTRDILSLTINSTYCQTLKLPSKLISLVMDDYSKKLELNKYMKTLHIAFGYCHKMYLNKFMRNLSLVYYWNDYVILNKMLIKLHVVNSSNETFKLPKYLTCLSIDVDFNVSILFSSNIVEMSIRCRSTNYSVLEHCTGQMRISIYYPCCHQFLDNLPNNNIPIVLETSNFQLKRANNLPSNLIVEIRN